MIEKVLTRVRGITPGIKRVLTGIRQMPLSLAHKAQLRAALLWSKVAQAPKGAVHAVARRRSGILHALVGMLGLSLMLVGAFGIAAVRYGMSLFERVNLGQLDIQPIVVRIADTAEVGLGISIGLVVAGLVLALGASSGFKNLLRSPITTYRKLIRGRDWLLAFVGRLQAESQKWKTTFNIMKLPYSILLKAGFSPQMAIGLLAIGGTAGGGVIVNETLLAERSFSRGDSGTYQAPIDIPIEYTEGSNTLRVDLGTTPVGLLELDSISTGTSYANSALPSGETNAVILGGLPTTADPVFAETFLEVGHLYIEKWRCSKLTLSDIEVNHLIVTKNAADGISHAAVAGTPRARGISGGVRANEMVVANSTYDQIKITAATTAVNGRVDEIRMVNIWTKNPCVISRVKAGTITITLSEFGNGDGLSVKDFIIATSVVYQTLTADQNIEILISPPA